jgi:GNAT superfamily N-acetyltransferase
VVLIEPFDPVSAPDDQVAAHHDLVVTIETEAAPGDEPRPLADFVAWSRIFTPSRRSWYWAAWEDESRRRMLGVSMFQYYDEPANRDMGSFWVWVRPENRGSGLGRALLPYVLDAAEAEGRPKLDAGTSDAVPAGAAFLERLGGRPAFTGRRNALDIDGVDRPMLDRWSERAAERAGDYVLEAWDAPCPADRVEAFVDAMHIMNTAPREDFDAEDDVFSVEWVRDHEAMNAARGAEQWVICAVHRPSGDIAGYTEVLLPSTWPTRVYQGDTGVDPAHRDKGLGRWLKAAMLRRLVVERPQVRRVVTFNAGSNEPMLNINHELGFRCIESRSVYQFDLKVIRDRLTA